MKTIKLNEELFDGQEEGFYNFDELTLIEGEKIRLGFDDFDKNYFGNIKSRLSENEIEYVVKELDLKPFIFDGNVFYNDVRGIGVFYCVKESIGEEKYIVIVSKGESQPSRYRIFILGAVITDKNIS